MIKLVDDWVIDVDERNYILAKDKGVVVDKKTGKEYRNLKSYGFFISITGALKALRDELIRQGVQDGCMTLSEAIRSIKEANSKVDTLLEELSSWE